MSFPRSYNAATDFVDRNVSAGNAHKTAFIDMQGAISYGELLAQCQRMAGLLRAHDIQRESRIAMLMLDTNEFPIVFWGAIRSGVVPVPLNTMLTTAQYRYILQDCRAQALFVSATLLPAVAEILADLPTLEKIFVCGADATNKAKAGSLALIDLHAALGEQPADAPAADTVADEIAFWLYSSGSTGMPKGVCHVHSAAMETARRYAHEVLGIRPDDVIFSAAKLFFAYGLGNAMSFPMSVGATTVLYDGRPTPEAVMARLRTHQVSVFCGVPTLYAAMLANEDCKPENSSSKLRLCISAGEALPAEIGRSFKARFGVDILDGVGSTEMLHIYLSNRPEDVRYGRSGKAVPGYALRLVDERGSQVDSGEVGELLVRGDSAAACYWNQREKSRNTFQGMWTRTGDKYTCDSQGYYEYCGRTDDMFKVSGIWVSPFEVESALITHPLVLEAGVVAAEDADGLLKPKAYVVLKPGNTATTDAHTLFETLKEHVKGQVGVWKYPRWIEIVDELPKTATGKIQRFKLRENSA